MPSVTDTDVQQPLALLETTSHTALTTFLDSAAGPAESVELSPDYFYNWGNWSKN